MLLNLQNNLIEEFFMDSTYSCVPPNKNNFKLLVLSGYDMEEKKNTYMCFYFSNE